MTLDNDYGAGANAGSMDGAGPNNVVASAVQSSPLQIGAVTPIDETERFTMSLCPRSGAYSSNADHTGQEGGRSIDSSFLRTHEPKFFMSQIDALFDDSNNVMNSDPFGRGEDTSNPSRRNIEFALYIEEDSSHKLMPLLSNAPAEKLECTAENDLLALNIENALGAVNRGIEALDFANEVKNSSQDQIVQATHPRYISMTQNYGIKDKDISDGYVNGMISKDESRESAESCSSAGSSVTGKKRRNPEQQLTFGSKRFNKQAEEDSPPSTSFVKHESSFMNWISNMVNGLSKSNQDTEPSCPLGLPDLNHGSEKQDQKAVMYLKNQDSECKVGFRAMFQSLYRPNTQAQGTKAIPGESIKFYDQFALTNEKFNQIRGGDKECPLTPHINPSPNFSAIQKICHTDSGNLLNLACRTKKDGDGMSLLNSSLGKRKADCAENNDFFPPSKGKASAHHGSFWITRLASKTSGSILNVDHYGGRSLENPTDNPTECTVIRPYGLDSSKKRKTFEPTDDSRKGPSNDVGTDLQNGVPVSEASFSLEQMKRPEDRKFVCRVESVDPNFASVCVKSSKAIASVFARRLDALEHVRQSDGINNAARTMRICFFCGSRGHNLQDCSEITDSELEDLLRNINAYDVVDESRSLCIRCFQLNHWAVACPSPSRCRELTCGTSLVNSFCSNKAHLIFDEESNQALLENNESLQVTGTDVVCGTSGPMVDTTGLHPGGANPGKLVLKADQMKCIALSHGKNSMALCNYVNQKIPDMAAFIFEAIKNLRLSRADIIKWMNSRIPHLPLEGFFLRVRLGKWEEGLGETGYYVACISGTGTQQNRSAQSSNEPISVNVGGVKCLVESRNISNHDFVEDELMAWWSTTAMRGGDFPSEESLRVKYEERRKLGL